MTKAEKIKKQIEENEDDFIARRIEKTAQIVIDRIVRNSEDQAERDRLFDLDLDNG